MPIGSSFYSFALVGLNSGAGGVILKSLSTFYHVGDAVLGTLFFVSALSYTLSSFFCGPLAERLSLHWLLALLWGWNSIYVALALLNLLQLGGIMLLLGGRAKPSGFIWRDL